MARSCWTLSSFVHKEVTAHKKKKQFCLNPVPFKEPQKQLQERSRSRVLEDLSPTPGPPREETSQGAGAEPRGAKHKEQRDCISSWEHPRFGYSTFMGS